VTEEEIKQLQTKLFTAGFRLVGTADGKLGPRTQMAIREFQRYAKMPQVAKEDTTATNSHQQRESRCPAFREAACCIPEPGRL